MRPQRHRRGRLGAADLRLRHLDDDVVGHARLLRARGHGLRACDRGLSLPRPRQPAVAARRRCRRTIGRARSSPSSSSRASGRTCQAERRAREENLPAVRRLAHRDVRASARVLVAIRFYEFTQLNVRWDQNAYGSITWIILGLHAAHLLTDLGDTAGADRADVHAARARQALQRRRGQRLLLVLRRRLLAAALPPDLLGAAMVRRFCRATARPGPASRAARAPGRRHAAATTRSTPWICASKINLVPVAGAGPRRGGACRRRSSPGAPGAPRPRRRGGARRRP